MPHTAAAALSFVGANLAAAAVSAQANDYGFSAIVGGITLAIGATCTMIVVVSPMIAKSIREGFPPIITALNDLRKQFEEAKKSTYTGQIDELKELLADLKEDNARVKADLAESEADRKARDERHIEREAFLLERVNDANSKAHDIRNKLNADILTRDAKILELEGVIESLRVEVARLTKLLEERAVVQDRKIEDNAVAIDKIIAAGTTAIDAIKGPQS
jgi:chromosome segregation ATPase